MYTEIGIALFAGGLILLVDGFVESLFEKGYQVDTKIHQGWSAWDGWVVLRRNWYSRNGHGMG